MKLFKYVLILVAVLGIVSCSDDEGTGAGDATIGFEQATYSYRESEGTVRIPVKFTGEPKSYPIVFTVEATVDPEKGMTDGKPVTVEQVAHFIQLENLRYVGNSDAPVFVEVKFENDDVVNDSRYLTLTIVSADGAEIVSGETTIEIRDNDANIYDRLLGRWLFKSINFDDGKPNPSFITYLMDGFTEEEAEKNRAANRIMCYGFGGWNESPGGKRFIWYLNYKYDEVSGEGSLAVDMTRAIISADEDVFGIGVNPTMLVFSTMPFNTTDEVIDLEIPIYANWSDDIRTITFDPETVLTPLLFSGGHFTGQTMGKLSKITMVRAD